MEAESGDRAPVGVIHRCIGWRPGRCYHLSTRRSENEDSNPGQCDHTTSSETTILAEASAVSGQNWTSSNQTTNQINLYIVSFDTFTPAGFDKSRHIFGLHRTEPHLQDRRDSRLVPWRWASICVDQCAKRMYAFLVSNNFTEAGSFKCI